MRKRNQPCRAVWQLERVIADLREGFGEEGTREGWVKREGEVRLGSAWRLCCRWCGDREGV